MATKVLVVFYSRNRTTEALAKSIADGAIESGAEVRVRRVRELVADAVMQSVPGWAENAAQMNAAYEAPTADDILWADAVLLGSPTRFGAMCSELKAFLDGLGGPWSQGLFVGKVGGAFASTSTTHGGNETTVLSMYPPLAHLGFVIVPTGYADASLFQAGSPYGATAVSGQQAALPTELDLTVARFQGRRTTEVAQALVGSRRSE